MSYSLLLMATVQARSTDARGETTGPYWCLTHASAWATRAEWLAHVDANGPCRGLLCELAQA